MGELFGNQLYSNTNDATSGQVYSFEKMQEIINKFKQLERENLRQWSTAIEKSGKCSLCGRGITFRRECGDALVMCERIFSMLRAACDPTTAAMLPEGTLGLLRLETFPCEPKAPLQ